MVHRSSHRIILMYFILKSHVKVADFTSEIIPPSHWLFVDWKLLALHHRTNLLMKIPESQYSRTCATFFIQIIYSFEIWLPSIVVLGWSLYWQQKLIPQFDHSSVESDYLCSFRIRLTDSHIICGTMLNCPKSRKLSWNYEAAGS